MIDAQHPSSILFITLDSCRYDTFVQTDAPSLKSIGPVHRAYAPAAFTYASHCAMFMGFTPGNPYVREPYINPKFAKIFKMVGPGFTGGGSEFVSLEGRNILDGLRRLGYLTLGTGAVDWFDTSTDTGRQLSVDFDRFYRPPLMWDVQKQVDWTAAQLSQANARNQPVLAFINVGETHSPYYHAGASWSPRPDPCVPFGQDNNADECRRRQSACLRFVDAALKPIIDAFSGSTTIACADHGDAWGEDGPWEHGVFHEKIFEVPLLFRLGQKPQPMTPGPVT